MSDLVRDRIVGFLMRWFTFVEIMSLLGIPTGIGGLLSLKKDIKKDTRQITQSIFYCPVVELERKISVRSTRDELIKKGVIKERVDEAIVETNENQSNATTTTIQAETTSPDPTTTTVVVNGEKEGSVPPTTTTTGERGNMTLTSISFCEKVAVV